MNVDFIIVGQGLAGTLLGFELLKAGKKVLFIDSPDYKKASEVAAGLINPVVFKRMTKSWRVDELYPQMLETYAGLEQMLGESFFFPLKIRKVFGKGDDLLWERKYFENDLEQYLSLGTDHSGHPQLEMPYGCGWIEKGGWVNLKRLLSLFKSWLQNRDLLLNETFQYDLLQIEQKSIRYKGIDAGKIIFCEGSQGNRNPFFREVRYKPVKGEILDLTIEDYCENNILNKSFFLLPVSGNSFRLGATYCWDPVDCNPTEAGKEELSRKLAQVLKTKFTVTGHQAGIRPTAHDRRPVIGLHPAIPVIGILNGLGAKGCLAGPYAAKELSNLLLNRSQTIPAEINVSRYFASGK